MPFSSHATTLALSLTRSYLDPLDKRVSFKMRVVDSNHDHWGQGPRSLPLDEPAKRLQGKGSNLQHSGSEPDGLPIELPCKGATA